MAGVLAVQADVCGQSGWATLSRLTTLTVTLVRVVSTVAP